MPARQLRAVLLGVVPLTIAVPLLATPLAPAETATRSPAAPTVYSCKSVDVSVYPNRIHVRCQVAAPGGIAFFAVPTANTAHANRLLSVLMMAHLSNRKVGVEYDPADLSGAAFGCDVSNCRRLLSAGIES